MALTSKNRKQITDLGAPVQISELNRQLDWIWKQLLGGMPLKGLSADAQETINSKVGSDDETYTQVVQDAQKIGWIVAGGDSESTMVLTDKVFQLVSANIDLTGKVTFTALDPDLSANFALKDGQTVINGNWVKTGKIDAQYLDVENLSFDRIINAVGGGQYAVVRTKGEQGAGGAVVSLLVGYADEAHGEYADDVLEIKHTSAGSMIKAPNSLELSANGAGVEVGHNGESGKIGFTGHLRSTTSGQYSLGTRGGEGEYRFKNVNITGSVDNTSDRRVKRDVADLDVDKLLSLLSLLRAREFRMIADGEEAKTRWGFIAQEVAEALKSLGISDVEFYNDENPEHLSLCYMELIAPLVAGYQALEARLSALEGNA